MTLFIAQDTDSTFTVRPGENTLQAAASAAAAASSAADAAQSAVYAGGFEVPEYSSQEAGEAATAAGDIFRVPLGTSPQTFSWYRRKLSGSESVAPLATSAYAEATYSKKTDLSAASGSELVGFNPASSVATTIDSKLIEFDSNCDLVNEFGLLAAHDAFRKLETTATSGPFYVGITGYGDSMADPNNYMMSVFVRALQLRYGLGGLFTPGLGQTWLGATWTFAGGAAQPRSDWTYLPGANQITMPSGSTASITTGFLDLGSANRNDGTYPREYSQLDGGLITTAQFRTVRCFYLKRPGDGTLTFTVSQSGVTGYSAVPVDCNAALALAYTDITVLDRGIPVSLSVAASSASCVFVGSVFLRESGVLAWSSQVGGSTMTQQKPYLDNGNYATIYKPLCQALSTALFVHAQRVPGDANWQANYPQVFDALDTIPSTSQLVLGEPPRGTEDSPTVPTINEFLRLICLSRGYAFYDQYRALGSSNAVLTTLGWGDADGVHLDGPAHRYLAGKLLKAVDWFRLGGNKLDIDPLTMGQLLKRLGQLQASINLGTTTIYGRSGSTIEGGAVSGGYTFAADNGKGFNFNSAAALGASAGRIGNVITNSPTITTANQSVYISFVGYRNLSLPAGVRAFALFGVTSTFSSLTALNQRCFGFECAKGSDVGSPGGVTGEVVRLLASNGTTTTYGPWVSANEPGTSPTSQTGLNLTVAWNKQKQQLELYRRAPELTKPVSVLQNTDLNSNSTAGAWANMAIVADDAGNVPAATGFFTVNEIKCFAHNTIYGLRGNDLIGA